MYKCIHTIIKGHNETALSNAILISRAAVARRSGRVRRVRSRRGPKIINRLPLSLARFTRSCAPPQRIPRRYTAPHTHVTRARARRVCGHYHLYTRMYMILYTGTRV